MKLVIQFDFDADIIDVPQSVIDNRMVLRKRFTKWLYNSKNSHRYWVKIRDGNGYEQRGVNYRSDAFVEWLNKKVLDKDEPATIVQQKICDYPDDLPFIFF